MSTVSSLTSPDHPRTQRTLSGIDHSENSALFSPVLLGETNECRPQSHHQQDTCSNPGSASRVHLTRMSNAWARARDWGSEDLGTSPFSGSAGSQSHWERAHSLPRCQHTEVGSDLIINTPVSSPSARQKDAGLMPHCNDFSGSAWSPQQFSSPSNVLFIPSNISYRSENYRNSPFDTNGETQRQGLQNRYLVLDSSLDRHASPIIPLTGALYNSHPVPHHFGSTIPNHISIQAGADRLISEPPAQQYLIRSPHEIMPPAPINTEHAPYEHQQPRKLFRSYDPVVSPTEEAQHGQRFQHCRQIPPPSDTRLDKNNSFSGSLQLPPAEKIHHGRRSASAIVSSHRLLSQNLSLNNTETPVCPWLRSIYPANSFMERNRDHFSEGNHGTALSELVAPTPTRPFPTPLTVSTLSPMLSLELSPNHLSSATSAEQLRSPLSEPLWAPDMLLEAQDRNGVSIPGALWQAIFNCYWEGCGISMTRASCSSYLNYLQKVFFHLSRHVGGKNQLFRCKWEGCKFECRATKIKLQRDRLQHVLTHTERWFYLCVQCGKTYSRKDTRSQRHSCRIRPGVGTPKECGKMTLSKFWTLYGNRPSGNSA